MCGDVWRCVLCSAQTESGDDTVIPAIPALCFDPGLCDVT